MTYQELEDAVWEARAIVSLRDDGTPTARGVPTHLLEALRSPEIREDVVGRLRGLGGARLEGLVCGKCCPEAEEAATKAAAGAADPYPFCRYRCCPVHGNELHYPRVP